MINRHPPFTTIESAHEFLSLLGEQIDEAMEEVRQELAASSDRAQSRRVEAWQVVLYSMARLSTRIAESRRLVNDLRTLRNLMYRTTELDEASAGEPQAPQVA